MDLFAWTDDISVGIDEIDEQHKTILKTASELLKACSLGAESTLVEVKKTLPSFSKAVREHFDYEERIFDEYNYPNKTEHLAGHKKLLSEIDNLTDRLNSSSTDIGEISDLIDSLCRWSKDHIIKEIKEYKDFWGRVKEESSAKR